TVETGRLRTSAAEDCGSIPVEVAHVPGSTRPKEALFKGRPGSVLPSLAIRGCAQSVWEGQRRMSSGLPPAQGLYDPRYEHDSCGVGFIVDLKGRRSHQLIRDGLTALLNLNHRGACGCENNTGDGAGLLIQVPHEFLVSRCRSLSIELP